MFDEFLKSTKISKRIFEDAKNSLNKLNNKSIMVSFIASPKSVMLILFVTTFMLSFGMNDLNIYGLPLIILGGYIYFHNRNVMGRIWSVKVEEKNKIITNGLFKHVRHPLYLGILLIYTGAIISTLNTLLLITFTALTLPYFYKRASIEEELLGKTLKGYKDYMKKTKMFLPKIF